jgi:hypothetical protein
LGWWRSLLQRESEDFVFAQLADTQVPGDTGSEQLMPNQHYVSIYLQSIRLAHVRKITSRFYGVVHAFASVPHRAGARAEFNTVVTPGRLRDVDPENLDRVIQMEKPIMGPVPYRGGNLELELGLFSIRSADLAAPFLELLEEVSGAAGVAFASAVQPFVAPLRRGIEALTSGDSLEIGLSRVFRTLSTGWYVILASAKESVAVDSIKIDDRDYRIIGTKLPYSYMVLQVVAARERPDWFMIPELQSTYRRLQRDVASGDDEAARESYGAFRRAVMTSDDLLQKDAETIAAAAEREMFAVDGPGRMFPSSSLPPLEELKLE